MGLCCKFDLSVMFERDVDCMYRFDSVQSAMRCITKLRERRDLHPSFSKVGFVLLCLNVLLLFIFVFRCIRVLLDVLLPRDRAEGK